MFTLPKLRHAQPWHEQLKVRQWVNQFFALHSRKRNYHVTIGKNPHGHLAWVHAEARRVYVSSSLLPVPPDHVRFDPVDEHRRTEMLLKALLAHEAGHVRFSGPNPGGKLGELWNSLEDERIERLMAREFHGLGPVFTFIGDIAAEMGRQAGLWSYTAMEGVLIWRFEHDRFHAHWAPRAEDHDIWHSTIRPLVELAWTLGTSDEVLAVAGEIMDVLRRHQNSLTPPPAPEPEPQAQTPPLEPDPASAEPDEEQEPGEQEGEPETDPGEDQGQFGDGCADGDGQPESGEPEPGGEQGDSDEGGGQAGGDEGQPDANQGGSSEEDTTDGEGQPDGGAGEPGGDQAQSGEDDSAAESEQPDAGEAEPGGEQGDSGEDGGQSGGDEEQPDTNQDGSSAGDGQADGGTAEPGDDQAPAGEGSSSDESGQPDGGEGQSTDDQAEADGGESSDANGPSSGNDQSGGDQNSGDQSGQPGRTSSPTSNVSPEQQAAENADDHCSPDAWEQVSASGADADERDGDADQRRAQEQEDGGTSGEQQESSPGQPQGSGDRSGAQEQQDASGQGHGRRASTQDTELPPMPQPDHGSGVIIAEDVEGHARRLAPLLKPPERPGRTRPHRSKGRYDARRDARDAERVFVRKTVASRPMPIRVRLLIDISISMGGEPIRCARAAAGMVVRAAALSGSSAEVHLFNTRHQAVITEPMPYLTAQALIAGIEVSGYTCLSPALAVLSDSPAHPLEKELIVIVCDGQLDETDYHQCAQIVKRGKGAGKEYLPVLISEAASDHQEWREIFGSALPCESVTDLGLNIKAALTNLRSRLGS